MLLTENTIVVDGEESKDNTHYNLLTLRPNEKTLGMPVGLHIYNLADPPTRQYVPGLVDQETQTRGPSGEFPLAKTSGPAGKKLCRF